MHRGARAIIISTALLLSGAAAVVATIEVYGLPWGQGHLYWVCLFGAFAVLLVLSGPAYAVLSFPLIVQWIGRRFGRSALLLTMIASCLAMTVLCCAALIASLITRAFHPQLIATLIGVTASLWGFLRYLLRAGAGRRAPGTDERR